MIVWRGIGIAVPLLLVVAGFITSTFVPNPRLGNFEFVGWMLLIGAGLSLVPAAISFAGKEAKWTHHTLFFIPVALWVPLLAVGGGAALVLKSPPASELAVGRWELDRCNDCPPALAQSVQDMTLDIGAGDVAVGDGPRRSYTLVVDNFPILRWRYDDDGSEEAMRFMGDDRFLGNLVDRDGTSYTVSFVRARELKAARRVRRPRACPRRRGARGCRWWPCRRSSPGWAASRRHRGRRA